MLAASKPDVRKAAALCLGFMGDVSCVNCLASSLADADPVVNQFAENALWNIWFRAAPRAAAELLAMGARCMNDQEYTTAIQFFNQALAIFPTFAEAYHQRGMAWHLLDRHEDAIKDYQQTLALMPQHFCAWAGLGQCHACLRHIPQALDAFEHAREINPRIEGVSEAIGDLRKLASREK
jgi:tetratricopeptide (TPR) repeat protein